MTKLATALVASLGFLSHAEALGLSIPAVTHALCQRHTRNPLAGCPPGTIYVSNSDDEADFSTIQAAVESLPDDDSAHVILIGAGEYVEQLNVTRPGPLTLLGQSDLPSRLRRYGWLDVDSEPANDVQVRWDMANYDGKFFDNVVTSVLTVGPTLEATLTGRGPTGYPVPEDTPFGCSDFRAYNIDFLNEEFPRSNGPAHAVGVSYANAGFYSCGLYGYQDTLYVGKNGSAYFYDNVIAGQTDFLYGFGTAYIESSTLSLRNCGGGITAWKGTNTTFENKYGVYVSNSQLLAANSTIAEAIVDKCPLGRPWNSLHRSVFMDTYFDDSVLPDGYIVWKGGSWNDNFDEKTLLAVYDVEGPGYDAAAARQSNVTKVLGKREAAPYLRPIDVFMTTLGKQPHVWWLDPIVWLVGPWA